METLGAKNGMRSERQRFRFRWRVWFRAIHRDIGYFSVLHQCPFPRDLYYPRDNHPNAAGYRKLATCVSAYLDLK